MSEPTPLPPLPPLPPEDAWKGHVERYWTMSEADRTAWWNTLTPEQKVEFEAANNRHVGRQSAQIAAERNRNKGAYACLTIGILAGLLVNVLVGGFFVLVGIAMFVMNRNQPVAATGYAAVAAPTPVKPGSWGVSAWRDMFKILGMAALVILGLAAIMAVVVYFNR